MQQVSLRDYCQEARSLIQTGKPEKTIPILRHILRHYPHHVESYRLLAQALLAEGDLDAAARQFGRVLSADPEDVTSRIGLAQIHRARGELGKAVRYMQRAVELSPGDPDLRVLHGEFVEAHGGDGGPDTVEITQAALGRIQADAGLYAKAVQEFKAVLQHNPDRADVQTTLAQVLWQMGDELQAAEICQRILEKLPNALKANLIIGALWLKNQQPDEAEPYLRTAQGLDPENLVAQSLFGEASPLPLAQIYIEPLGEEEIESVQQPPPPILPEDSTPVSEGRKPAIDWMSELHEEEFTPMSDEERADEEFELPDWLKGVGDDLLGESDEQPAASRPDEPELEEEEETPAWLRDLVARAEESDVAEEPAPAEPGDAPSWLQELRPELSEETPSEPETPDWLASLGEAPSDEEWLRTTADLEEAPSAPYEPEPLAEEPLLSEPEATVIPVAGARDDDSDLPDWLREVREGKTQPEPEAEGAIEEPEPSLLEPVGDAVEESDVPDWLREITTGEPTPSDEAELLVEADQPAPEAEIDEEGLPDWLRTFAEPATEAEITETQPEAPEVSEESVVTADEGRALWQQILAEEGVDLTRAEEAPPEEAAGMTAEEWLRSTVGLEETPVSSRQPEPVAEEPEAEQPEALEVMREPEGELPDWMREIQEPAAGVEPPAEPVADEEAEEVLEVEVDEAGLPDWLQEPTAETTDVLEPKPAAPAETPEWLTEIESEEMLMMESDIEEPMDLETGEMPEWLGEVIAGELPLSEEWAPEPEEAEAMEAQVPEWLREFRDLGMEAAEPTTEAAEFEAPAEAEEQEEFAEPPELPEWLVHLREGVVEAEAPPPIEELPPEISVEAEAEPLGEVSAEPEVAEVEEVGPEWVEEPVALEEGLPELELIEEEEEFPTPEVVPSQIEPEPVEVPELAEVAEPERIITRELEALSVEDLPKDPGARLSMARGALDTGDWSDALMIYETLVSSSEMLDTVIENLEVGVRRHPDDPAGYQLLGDACMKDGRLGAALEAYRTALSKL